MNANGLAKQYSQLTGEERFKLIIAAEERGDEVEADRLAIRLGPAVLPAGTLPFLLTEGEVR
jgi:hypothetical protein